MPAGSGPSAGLRPGEVRSAVTEAPASQCALPLPGESVDAPPTVWDVASHARLPLPGESVDGVTGTAGTVCAPPPPGGKSADGDRDVAVARAPPPGGVELVMSPRLALCEAGWRESSRGGFRRAGLARCEAGWTVSRWARITQARPGPRRSGAGPGVVHAIAGLIPMPVPAHPDQVREHVT